MLFTAPCVDRVDALFEKTNALCYEGQQDKRLWNLLVEALVQGKSAEVTDQHYKDWLVRLYREAYKPALDEVNP